MHLYCDDVNEAFLAIVQGIASGSIPTRKYTSRVGDVLRVEEPLLLTYRRPRNRVLFNSARDCNPFFHLMEALWMLAGSDDVAFVSQFNSRMPEFSDNGSTFHGAYGRRWRYAFSVDQPRVIAKNLRDNPWCRRQVLQIWDARKDLGTDSKDIPCNTQAYFGVREDQGKLVLDMTVCNRSNDIVWGMLGANVVHFSYLQEYVAANAGLQVGHYHQMTNNAHVYCDRFSPEKWLACEDRKKRTAHDPKLVYYAGTNRAVTWGIEVTPGCPLVQSPEQFEKDLHQFVGYSREFPRNRPHFGLQFREPFFQDVARHMAAAFRMHNLRDYKAALQFVDRVKAPDWRIAGKQWLQKRESNWEKAWKKARQQELTSGEQSDG